LVADAPGDSDISIQENNPWIGDVELAANQVAFLKWSFQCVVCHCNGHIIQFCPFMKNYEISKKVLPPQGNKPLDDSVAIIPAPSASSKTSFAVDIKMGKPMGSVSAVTESLIVENCSNVLPIEGEESENEFPALLEGDVDLVNSSESEDDSIDSLDVFVSELADCYVDGVVGVGVTATNAANVAYSDLPCLLIHPMGSSQVVKSALLHIRYDENKRIGLDLEKGSMALSFQMIVDSGTTSHMFPFWQAFILYSATPGNMSIGRKFLLLELVLYISVLVVAMYSCVMFYI